MKVDRDLLISKPVWARLPGLSFNLLGPRVISALLSTICIPIRMDEATKNRTRISFAHVLVEVEAEFGFSTHVEAEDENGFVYS